MIRVTVMLSRLPFVKGGQPYLLVQVAMESLGERGILHIKVTPYLLVVAGGGHPVTVRVMR